MIAPQLETPERLNGSIPKLRVKNLSIQFGGLKAVTNLDLEVSQGSITALIGPNGAGKTTVFNMLTGVYRPTSGQIEFEGKSLLGKRPFEITRMGLARTFQNIRLFKDLSVLDNVRIGGDIHNKHGFIASALQTPGFLRDEAALQKRCLEILSMLQLEKRPHELAKNLSYGAQRRLEIARALATGVRLLFLDEPAAGMNSQEKIELMQTIRKLREQFNLTILLIEHDMKLVMGVSEKIIVLDHGEKIAQGAPKEIQQNPRVIEAYLGAGKRPDAEAKSPQSISEIITLVSSSKDKAATEARAQRAIAAEPATACLEVENLTVHYGAVRALNSISFKVPQGKIVTLIGSNGAGKSTTLRALSGMRVPTTGKISWKGQSLLGLRPEKIVGLGIAQAPEGRGIFLNLTVKENLELGAFTRTDKAEIAKDLDYVFTLLPRLKERFRQDAGTMSGGEQQMLAIGRALMAKPELLLLDEPSLGLAPQVTERIFDIIQRINQKGMTVLLVEQNALIALEASHEAVVLETGEVVKQGPAKELLASDEIKRAYLGEN